MCFSAQASFAASFVLLVVGIFALKNNKHKKYLMLSLTPILFAIQQFAEGVVWISLQNKAYACMQPVSTYVFLSFALLMWPIFSSLSLLLIEKHASRKSILEYFLSASIVWSLYVGITLFMHEPFAAIVKNHIIYGIMPNIAKQIIDVSIYAILTVVPFFITHIKQLHTLGALMLVTGIGSYFIWSFCVTSVWCFFAAISSIFIYYIVTRNSLPDVAEKV
jgi:hypothetical protein